MLVVSLNNGVSLDYYDQDGEIAPQHYAFWSANGFDEVSPFANGASRIGGPGRGRPVKSTASLAGAGSISRIRRAFLEVMTRPYEIG
jgi:hypothetical protein